MSTLHNKFVVMYKLIALSICVTAMTFPASGQLVFTRDFTEKMHRANLKFVEPVELWLHVYPLDGDAFMRYDLVLQNDRNDFEMRFRLRFPEGTRADVPQNVEASRLLASISSNTDGSEIQMEIPDTAFWQAHFNAHDGMIAHFVPKADFSEKSYGTLISILSLDSVIVDVIILRNDGNYHPMEAFRNLWFARVNE